MERFCLFPFFPQVNATNQSLLQLIVASVAVAISQLTV